MSVAQLVNIFSRTANMARTGPIDSEETMDSRAHVEYETVLARHLNKQPSNQGIATLDNGANTTVLGRVFQVHAIYPHRPANLFGFNPVPAQKKGLQMVRADDIQPPIPHGY